MAIGSTNLDVGGIVSQLMSIEQRPIAALNKKEADYQAKISAYGNISGALSSFQTSVQDLVKLDKFKSLKANTSNGDALKVSASDKATPGSHTLEISTLAQPQKLSVAGRTSDIESIGSGATSQITFDFGKISNGTFDKSSGKYSEAGFSSNGEGSKTIVIDSSNNTLRGIRDTINNAQMGITASIINDGSDAPYTLTLSPSNPGANNSLKISATGDEAIASMLAHDPSGKQNLSEMLKAQDAAFTVDGVSISKPSNSISDVIDGLTLDLQQTTKEPVTLSVSRDSAPITNSVQGFVKGYNELQKTLRDIASYNSATKQGSILQGDTTLLNLQSQIRATLNTPVKNTGGEISTLSQIGVTLQKDGNMELDTGKLNAAIAKNPNDVASLFASVGRTSDPMITFDAAGSNTGSYPINVTKLATKASLGGCEEVETLIIEKGQNDGLEVTIDGVRASITLAEGEYSFDSLAREIQSKINGASTLSGAGVSATVVHDQYGYLITSNSFGSKSNVDISGNGALNLIGKNPVRTPGTDVEGMINGVAASGSGQTLTVNDGAALGLKVQVGGGALGDRGRISYSEGYARTLDKLLSGFLSKDGQLESRKKGLSSSIKDIDNRRDTLQQRLPTQEARYRKQYSNLEASLSNMSKTSNYLNQQLANLPKPY